MRELGICRRSGRLYEGNSSAATSVNYHAPLLPIEFVGVDMQLNNLSDGYPSLIFREDSFDPITKVRRGRVYSRRIGSNEPWKVHDPARNDLKRVLWGQGEAQELDAISYNADSLTELRGVTPLPKVILGQEPFQSFWQILAIENQLNGKPSVILKALHSFGVVPELLSNKVPKDTLVPLTEALQKVEASANRLGPVDTVDRCRDALSIVFGALAGDRKLDLGLGVKKRIEANQKLQPRSNGEDLVTMCGNIVARLHARGKPNEQFHRDTRVVTDEDASLALKSLWFILVELNWARPYT